VHLYAHLLPACLKRGACDFEISPFLRSLAGSLSSKEGGSDCLAGYSNNLRTEWANAFCPDHDDVVDDDDVEDVDDVEGDDDVEEH